MNFEHVTGPPRMGIFGWTTEEKIGSGMFDWLSAGGTSDLGDITKGDLTRQAKVLLGMYQQKVLSGDYEPFDGSFESANSNELAMSLTQRSMFPREVVLAFLWSMWDLTKSGDIELKHLSPTEATTKAATTGILPSKETIEEWTPQSIKSVLDMDVPSMIQKNVVFLTVLGLSGAALFYMAKRRQPKGAI